MNLSDRMDFDHIIVVDANGEVHDAPTGVLYAPELVDSELPWGSGWELLDGYSRQDRYAGPIMHACERIGGQMARDILATPGVYVALVDYPSDGGEPEGWAVAYMDPDDAGCDVVGHDFGGWERSRFAGTLHRNCQRVGCQVITLDGEGE